MSAPLDSDPLPRLDEHSTDIDADAADVWTALGATLDATMSRPWSGVAGSVLGCADTRAAGPRPLTEGSTVPGFRVAGAVPGALLALEGSHRYSSYALIFRLERADEGRIRLRAESRATFPGFGGGTYRLLVVGTGGHGIAVRRLLAAVKHRSERWTALR
jgi:hypothetical protein